MRQSDPQSATLSPPPPPSQSIYLSVCQSLSRPTLGLLMCLFVLVSKSAARLVNRLSLLPVAVAVACGGLQQHVAAVVAVAAVAVAVAVLSLVFRIDVSRLPN